jgi:hypothetical protein
MDPRLDISLECVIIDVRIWRDKTPRTSVVSFGNLSYPKQFTLVTSFVGSKFPLPLTLTASVRGQGWIRLTPRVESRRQARRETQRSPAEWIQEGGGLRTDVMNTSAKRTMDPPASGTELMPLRARTPPAPFTGRAALYHPDTVCIYTLYIASIT